MALLLPREEVHPGQPLGLEEEEDACMQGWSEIVKATTVCCRGAMERRRKLEIASSCVVNHQPQTKTLWSGPRPGCTFPRGNSPRLVPSPLPPHALTSSRLLTTVSAIHARVSLLLKPYKYAPAAFAFPQVSFTQSTSPRAVQHRPHLGQDGDP